MKTGSAKVNNYLMEVTKQPSLTTMTPQQARALRAAAPKSTLPLPALATIDQRDIAVRDGATIRACIYTPVGAGPFPVIIYYHGGGWVLNTLEMADLTCAYLANITNHIVVSIEYRKAPEYKFPVPVNDACDAFNWVYKNYNQFNGNAVISVAGDSAGANLAIAVTQENKVANQILLYPVTNAEMNTASYEQFAEGYGLDRDVMAWFIQHYISTAADRKNPLVSPLNATSFTHFPRSFIQVAAYDVLKDEGIAFAKRLQQAGVETSLQIAENLVHSYFTKPAIFLPEIIATIEQINQFLLKKS